MALVYLLLGSNLGNRKLIIENACQQLNDIIGPVQKKSSVYITKPWGFKSKSDFFNQVILIKTELMPPDILKKIHQIEASQGRIRSSGEYCDRTIDIDILLYDETIIDSTELQIPHPRLHERKFTMVPLAEIAADLIHPVFNKSISTLLSECNDLN